ncbi:MAG TPA: hypothetical protein VF062_10355 [Candidatus Limnocylindrales bacterium]
MPTLRRALSPAGFLLAAACFLLPFLGVHFDTPTQRGRAGWNGADLVVGGEASESLRIIWYTENGALGSEETTIERFYGAEGAQRFLPRRFLHSQALAIIAALMVLAGLSSAILAGARVQATVAALAGFAGAASLALAEARALAFTGPYTAPEYGFWLAFALLAALGCANAIHTLRLRRAAHAS